MKVSVIVLTKDIKNNIDRVVDSFSAQEIVRSDSEQEHGSQRVLFSADEYEVLVQNSVDDNEINDELLEKISRYPQIKLLTSDEKSSKSFECSATENSSGDIIVFASDDYKYPSNWLSTIIDTYKTNQSISAVLADCKVDDSFALGTDGIILKKLGFLSIKKRVNLAMTGIVDFNTLCLEDLLLVDNIAITRDWLVKVYQNDSIETLSIASILTQLEVSGVLYYNNELVSKFIVDENFSSKKYLKDLGVKLSNSFVIPEHYDYKLVCLLPFNFDRVMKKISFPFKGALVLSSFLMIHIFFTLFLIDMLFFSGLFSSLTPWVFLFFAFLASLFTFGDVINSDNDLEIDKFTMIKFKYFSNISYFYGLISTSIKRNMFVITKPFL